MVPEVKKLDTFLVCYDKNSPKDQPVLVVGRRDHPGITTVINTFVGEEADELYNLLIKKKEER